MGSWVMEKDNANFSMTIISKAHQLPPNVYLDGFLGTVCIYDFGVKCTFN